MLGLNYENWKSTCERYFEQIAHNSSSYLQTFPFSKLSDDDKTLICSQDFFDNHINNGACFYSEFNWFVTANPTLMKSDGMFRTSSLVSPLMYLLLIVLGKEISLKYVQKRNRDFEIHYAGDFENDGYVYSDPYDDFCKSVNLASEQYQYYIKTDIKDFFPNINLNTLWHIISNNLQKSGQPLAQRYFLTYREFMRFLGQGNYPLLENNSATSYFATIVYLDEADSAIYDYVSSLPAIKDFKILRFVDDMYIFFNPNENCDARQIYDKVKNKYQTFLLEYGLSLNLKKTKYDQSDNISEDLSQSLYHEYVNGIEFQLTDLIEPRKIYEFLEELKTKVIEKALDEDVYLGLVKKHFKIDGVKYSANDIFNDFVFNVTNEVLFQDDEIISLVSSMLENGYHFIKYDPKRLFTIIMKTKQDHLIKGTLNSIFRNTRNDDWSIYDLLVTITYLLKSGFRHIDLLNIIRERQLKLYNYYCLFCKKSFIAENSKAISILDDFCKKVYQPADETLFFLYFMSKSCHRKGDYFEGFAYYKTFFDRMTAHLGERDRNDNLNFNAYHKASQLKEFYPQNDTLLTKACKKRNSHPLCHSSAETLEEQDAKETFEELIKGLRVILHNKIDECLWEIDGQGEYPPRPKTY